MSEEIKTDLLDPAPLLFNQKHEGAGQALAPTQENILKALSAPAVETRSFVHEASGIEFKVQRMPSTAYTNLENVVEYDEMTGQRKSTDVTEEHKRQLIYLVNGVSEPKLDKDLANKMLTKPGWGFSNIELINAIKLLNPPPQQAVSDVQITAGAGRWLIVILKILSVAGAVDDLIKKYRLNPKAALVINQFLDSMFTVTGAEAAAETWGLRMERSWIVMPEEEENPAAKIAEEVANGEAVEEE